MLKNKLIEIFTCIICITAVFTGCSPSGGKRRVNTENTPVNTPIKEVRPYRLEPVESNFEKGKQLLLSGDPEGAKFYFDKVIDLLLNLDPALKTPGYQDYADYYITGISEIELSYLKDRLLSSGAIEEQESFLDEVVSTPLFPPSEHEIEQLQENLDLQAPQYSIPLTINSQVVSFIKAFQDIRHKNIQNALNRSVEYIDEFKRIFKEQGLPEDLAYLPLIESGYRIDAISRARAQGMWQFMASTARLFGLTVDWVVDERKDPYKAAVAAAKYLKQLYDELGDWYLALASYNGGTGRLKRGMQHLNTNDFFRIAKSRHIRRETRNYVPAFLAALVIAKNPTTYGFTIEKDKEEKIFANTKTIQIPSPVELSQVAALANISLNDLQKMNPELIREFTPFDKEFYTLRVPNTIDESSLAQIQRLPPAKRYFIGWYQVRRGDTLYSIARKFNTSVKQIKKANKLKSNLIHPGKQLLIPRGT